MDDRRSQLLQRITEGQQAWRALVDEIGQARITEPGPMGGWSFKDLASHLLGWRDRTIARLEAAAAGRPDPPDPWPADLDDDDAINDWLQQQAAGRSTEAVLGDVDASYDRLRAALDRLSDTQLSEPDAITWLDGEAVVDVDWLSHWHEEHEPTVRGWLDGSQTEA